MKFIKIIFLAAALALCGCSQKQDAAPSGDTDGFDEEFAKREVFDPLSGYNRVMTSFNDVFYSYILTPVASGYDYVMPDPIQGAFSNFFYNILYPMRLVNNLLQGKFENSWDETKRFLINSTVGFGGLNDMAGKYYGISRHDEDFGQTLGYWGVPAGPHIVWPILGQSNLRDTFGMVGDYFTNPISYIEDGTVRNSVNGFRIFNDYSRDPKFYEKMTKDAVDLYPFLRDAYEQNREKLIKE